MTFSLGPGAESDVADALDFYAGHAGDAVARRFLIEFERVAQLLVEHPRLRHTDHQWSPRVSSASLSLVRTLTAPGT